MALVLEKTGRNRDGSQRNLRCACVAKISTRKETAWKEGTAEVNTHQRQSITRISCAEQSCRNITPSVYKGYQASVNLRAEHLGT